MSAPGEVLQGWQATETAILQVKPYYFDFLCSVKKRWLGMTIIDVFAEVYNLSTLQLSRWRSVPVHIIWSTCSERMLRTAIFK